MSEPASTAELCMRERETARRERERKVGEERERASCSAENKTRGRKGARNEVGVIYIYGAREGRV